MLNSVRLGGVSIVFIQQVRAGLLFVFACLFVCFESGERSRVNMESMASRGGQSAFADG